MAKFASAPATPSTALPHGDTHRDLLALGGGGGGRRSAGPVALPWPASQRDCHAALARLDELSSPEQRRRVCRHTAIAAAMLCQTSGALWTPLLDAVSEAYTRCGGTPHALVASAVREVVDAMTTALRRRDDHRLALRLLRRWRSSLVHSTVLRHGLGHGIGQCQRASPALRRAILALPATALAELSYVPYPGTAAWLQLLEAARLELLERLEATAPATADAQLLVGALARLAVACADRAWLLSPVARATSAAPAATPGPTAALRSQTPLDSETGADDLWRLAHGAPVPERARQRRSIWDPRTLAAIQRVLTCATSAGHPPERPFGVPGDIADDIDSWLELALQPPITPADAQRLLQVARPYARWRPLHSDDTQVPPVLALLAYDGVPEAVVVRTAHTLSDAEWAAAVPALVRRAAVRAEPALRQRLTQRASPVVQAILALDEPVATLGARLRALLACDPAYALQAIAARREDAAQVLRRPDLLPLLRSEVGSVRRDAATLLHLLRP